MSTDFLTHYRVPIPLAQRYGENNLRYWLLRVFTLPSIPGKNPLTLVFKVQWNALVFSFPVLSLVQTYLSIRKEIVNFGGIEPPKIHAPIPPCAEATGFLGGF
jgi:hypothetical protein